MSSVAYALVILLSLEIQVHSKPTCEDDGLSIADLRKAKDESRQEQIRRELSSDDGESAGEKLSHSDRPTQEAAVEGSDEGKELISKISADDGSSDLKKAMENEGSDSNLKGVINKTKRQICDRILEQLRDLPCDNPVVVTCGEENREYPCIGHRPESPLRAALSDVDDILGAAGAGPQPLVQQSALIPSLLPSPAQVSPVQTLPISSPSMAANLLPGVTGILTQPAPSFLPARRVLTAEERRERQKGIFEGLLRFGTVVNHIDSFLTDKSKMIIRGLHRMVQSEEDSRFN